MGQRLCVLAGETDGVTLSEAFEAPGHAALGQSADATGDVIVTDGFTGKARVLIDFTTPEATRAHVAVCGRLGVAAVIGTTGLSDADHAAIDATAENVAIIQAPNMALGVNLLFTLAARAAKQLGEDYDIEIVETHHRFKADAPSGTALGIAEAICDATGRDIKTDLKHGRAGDDPRQPGQIGMHAVRIGDCVGEHTAYFAGLGERLELKHVATNRDTFARGALRAALWLADRGPGRYTMADVLGLNQ